MVRAVRALIVARWYPAHDDPGRGSFVADLVAALRGENVDVRVASWEFAHYRPTTSAASVTRARDAWSGAVTHRDSMNTPRTWGAGVPVARLPALYVAGESVQQRIDGHAALLVPFGTALHDRWPFDVIHAHTAVPDGAAAIELGRAIGVPVMVTEHDRSLRQRLATSEEERASYRAVLEGAGLVAAVSAQFRDLLCGAVGLEAAAMDVVPNPIPDVFFGGSLDGARDGDELLYVGGRKEDKGIVTLLQAFALVHEARPALRLRLVGRSANDADEARWHTMAEELRIGEAVRFEAPADRDGVARAMREAAVFVHPSPFESFGMVAAEALASGLPIAATPSGIEEIVGTDGTLGEIASGHAPEQLSATILRVVDRRATFAPEAQRSRASRFRASSVAAATIARYRTIVDRAPVRAAAAAADRAGSPISEGTEARSDADRAVEAALVLGQNATLAERRLATFPTPLRDRLLLLTRKPGPGLLAAMRDRLVELDPVAAYGRLLAELGAPPGARWSIAQRVGHFVRAPGRSLQRRRLREERTQVLDELLDQEIVAGWGRVRSEAHGEPVLVAMDVDDVLTARRALPDTPVAPGATRWLADRWDAARSPVDAPR
jgi:glycosyltransferase involved in cell wall biosynthesis